MLLITSTALAETYTIEVTDDTYVTSAEISGNGLLSTVRISLANPSLTAVFPFWKMNVSEIRELAIDEMYMTWYVTTAHSASCAWEIGYFLDNEWNQTELNYTNVPDDSTRTDFVLMYINETGSYTSNNIFDTAVGGETSYTGLIYSQDIISYSKDPTLVGSCDSNAEGNITSIEGGSGMKLIAEAYTYYKHTIQGTDTPYTCFDFESQRATTSFNAQSDFCYNASSNTMEVYSPALFASRGASENTTNDLDQYACSGEIGYGFSDIVNINFPSGEYDVYCFNQSNDHDNYPFFAAIKVINNTNVRGGSNEEFDFHYALFSPSFVTFSVPEADPDPVVKLHNATFTWTTTQPLSDGIRIRNYNLFDNVIGIYTQSRFINFTTDHEYEIDGYAFRPEAAYIEVQLFGQDSNADSYNSQWHRFEVTSAPTSDEDYLSDLVQLQEGIHVLVKDLNGNYISSALVSLDNGIPVQVNNINIPDNSSIGFHSVWLASFYPENTTGEHNTTVNAEGFTGITKTFNVIFVPHFETVTLAIGTGCFEANVFNTRNLAEANGELTFNESLANGFNSTSWYCTYDPDVCNYFSNGKCIGYGRWIIYVCVDNYHPSGIPANACIDIGTQVNGTASITNTFADPIAALLGTNVSGVLAMISLIISIILMGVIALYSKSGLVGIVTFIGSLVLFTSIGWFPIIYVILLGIVSAFIVAKWMTSGVGGGD